MIKHSSLQDRCKTESARTSDEGDIEGERRDTIRSGRATTKIWAVERDRRAILTVAQTGQFLDVLHRPGNVHDSNGAHDFMMDNFDRVRALLPDTVLESRLDSAFFSRKTLTLMDLYSVEATVSVPFERFPVLKQMIAARRRWLPLDGERSYFESDWNPDSWSASYRFLFVRRKVRRQVKGALQLDLFEPREIDHDYGQVPSCV